MPKKTINTSLETKESQSQTKALSEQVIFSPTSTQGKIKARFWTRFQPGPMADSRNVSLAQALEVTQAPQLRKWWAEDGFQDWFLNREEAKERLQYLFQKGLDAAENILDNPEANANAKANILKLLAEMTGHLTKKPVDRFADEQVNKMSEEQLKAYLEKKGVTFTQEKIIDVQSTDATSSAEEVDS